MFNKNKCGVVRGPTQGCLSIERARVRERVWLHAHYHILITVCLAHSPPIGHAIH